MRSPLQVVLFVFVALYGSIFIPKTVDSALVSWWQGENNALDSAGTNNGSLVAGTTFGTGVSGKSFQFDGVDDVVNVPDSPSLAITGSLTIDAWIKPFAYTPVDGGLIVFRGATRGGLDPYFLALIPTEKLNSRSIMG